MDSGVRRRVGPAESRIGPDGFLRAADGDRTGSHGGRRVLRAVPAALAEGRSHGSVATATHRGRAITAVAHGYRADATQEFRPVWHRISGRRTACGVPLLEVASRRNDVLPDGCSVGRACASYRGAACLQADSRGPVPGATVVDIGDGKALRTRS